MPKYFSFGEAIEGKKILCTFKEGPYKLESENGRSKVSIKGYATAVLIVEWKRRQ